MMLKQLPLTDNVHRPDPIGCDSYTETDEQGQEWIVPERLWCTAPILTLKDTSLRWVAKDEAKRLKAILRESHADLYEAWDAGERDEPMTISDTLAVAAREGFGIVVGLTYSLPDDGIEEKNYLVRSEAGEHLVVTAVLSEGESDYLHDVDTSCSDDEGDAWILRLEATSDIRLANEHDLLCRDATGPHVQVVPWRSVLSQCRDAEGRLDEKRLLEFWRERVNLSAP
jgi:hypothetical protein